MLVALFVTGWSSFAVRLDHLVRTLLLAAIGPALAIGFELAGLVSPTWHVREHSIEVFRRPRSTWEAT